MAKLGSYYGLCPLIDHRSLLGISDGQEDGTVVVTLGKNIAIKYRLSDQKQLHSWRTKEKFSSPIIFDKEQAKYVAVFNQTFIRLWDSDDEYLDKLKKLKFNQQINTIFECDNKSVVVFNNGWVGLLKETLEIRKSSAFEGVLEENEVINDLIYTCLNGNIYVGLIVSSSLRWTKFASDKWEKFNKIELKRENCDLSGQVFHIENQCVHFLSLWSDGQIHSTPLNVSEPKSDLFMVVSPISCKTYVSLLSLDENYIALYGNNCNEEGALLVIHNVQFNVVQSKQPFKIFTNGAKLWRIGSNLLFPVGQNLAVIPFHLALEQMGALIGSHKIDPNLDVAIVQKMVEVNWTGHKRRKPMKHSNSNLLKQIQDFVKQGSNEEQAVEYLLSDLLEKDDLVSLNQSVKYFQITEKYLAKILKFVLNSTNLVQKPFSTQIELIDSILVRNFNESLFLPNLRNELNLSNVLTLLEYICYLLNEENCLGTFNFTETQQKLTEWICILLDANYQKFLLSKDEETKNLLLLLNKLVEDEMNCLNNLQEIAPILTEIKNGKNIYKTNNYTDNLNYCIEDLKLY